jgi:hypothetical protein
MKFPEKPDIFLKYRMADRVSFNFGLHTNQATLIFPNVAKNRENISAFYRIKSPPLSGNTKNQGAVSGVFATYPFSSG